MIPRTTVDISEGEKKAISRVIESGQFVKGKECEEFEKEFSSYQGVKYGAGVNSGTSALHLSLLALDLKPGDEVITVPNTFAATVNAIIIAEGKPVFVDIDPETFTIDVEKITEKITEKTKVILPVHLYGLMADMKHIKDIAEDNNLLILEDACQAHGAEINGKKAGQFGDLAAFSFFPTKNITVAGDGGMVISNNEELIQKVKALRDHGRINKKHVMAGLNNRMSEILAAIGREHLKKIEQFTQHRKKIAALYKNKLKDIEQITLPIEPRNYKHVYHLYTIKANDRDDLKSYLYSKNIGSSIMYAEQLNKLDYVIQVAGIQNTPINEQINKEILSIPISGTLDLNLVEQITDTIIKRYN
ncbi:MAG: DegT/DnrJ/EryC1/StrS family aminotransferase [Candidatus Heimdallarchaeaceae archaeon]